MATTKGIIPESLTDTFNGQSDVAIFDAPAGGYTANTTFADVTASGFSLGQIVEDSTSWDGEDVSLESIVDEQGDTIVSTVKKGTYAMSFDVANLSADMVGKLLKGKMVSIADGAEGGVSDVKNVVKFIDLPVMTRPLAVFNDEANKWMLMPKAKIAGNLKYDGKLWRIHLSAVAEFINTPELGTFMKGEGTPNYSTETAD